MLKNVAFLLMMSLVGSFALAQETSSTTSIERDSSEANRNDKTASVTWFTEASAPFAMTGIEAGFFLNPTSVLHFAVTTGKHKNENGSPSFGFTNEIDERSGSQATLSFKKFLGNSFYTKLGAGYQKMDIKNQHANTFFGLGNPSSPRDSYEFSGNRTFGYVSIGNQWQWSNFTLGCDWVGINVPLASEVTSEKSTSYSSSSLIATEMKDAQDDYLRKTSYMASFYLGASF